MELLTGSIPTQAQTPWKGFILRHRHVFGWHLVRQVCALLTAVRHDGLFHATVDPWLHAVGRADQPSEARDPQEQTPETHPTGPHVGVDEVERHNQAMQEGEPRHTVQERHDSRTRIKALLVRAPCLQRGAGHLKPLGDVPRGEALGFEIVIRRQEVSALEALPTWVAILVASLLLLDYRAHRYLLGPCFAFGVVMAKDGEGAFLFQPFVVSSL
jgi:hypothetical protein